VAAAMTLGLRAAAAPDRAAVGVSVPAN